MRFFLFFLIFFYSQTLLAQSFFSVSGIVMDSTSKEPLPYVSIGIAGTAVGAIANEQGVFKLNVPFVKQATDTLNITLLGYKTEKIPIKNIEKNKLLIIKLLQNSDKLNTVEIVSNYTVSDLIRDALKKVNENYYEEKPVYFL